jgi:type VI secretion system protein VasI
MSGSLDRLNCYDLLARQKGLDGPQSMGGEPVTAGNWDVSRTKNPIDDSETVVIRLDAESGSGQFGEPVSLIVRCKSNVTEAYIVWNDFLATDDRSYAGNWKNVTVRFGNEEAKVERWSTSTDQTATFMSDPVIPALRAMATSSQFVAQTTPFNASPITAVFNTAEMEIALQPLMEVCGWSLES